MQIPNKKPVELLWSRGGLVPACLAGFQAHTQGRSLGGSGLGGGSEAHTKGGSWGGSGPGPPMPMTATAAGGTHPTGMHSCFKCLCQARNEW